jgi:ketol-acid reductoisomerase
MSGAPRVAIIGYGNQGAAQAHCLRASGWTVVVGARPGASADRARAAEFEVRTPAEAVAIAEFVAPLVPDPAFPALYRDALSAAMRPSSILVFAHGYSILYGKITWRPDVDVALVSPTAPGSVLAQEFDAGRGVPAYLAVAADPSGRAWVRAETYATGLGSHRAQLLRTTVEEEVIVDLFGEQVVLVGGLMELISNAVDVLVRAGYSPAMAYLECAHQLKYMADLLHREGPRGFTRAVSGTAMFGGLTRGPRVVGEQARRKMEEILAELRDGRFARELSTDQTSGGTALWNLTAQADAGRWGRLQAARDQATGPGSGPGPPR